MTPTLIGFKFELPYMGGDRPCVLAQIRRNGDVLDLPMKLDSGCDWSLVRGDILMPLGFRPLPDSVVIGADTGPNAHDKLAALGCKKLRSAGEGAPPIYGQEFPVTLSVDGGPQDLDFTIHGSVVNHVDRMLLGRDFFRAVSIVGFDDTEETIYLGEDTTW